MPARRYLVSPQGGGPLTYLSATLPAATMAAPYSQPTTIFVSAGVPAYAPFSLLAQTGPDNFAMTTNGVITGTPEVPSVRVTNDGSYRITNVPDVRLAT